MLQAVFYSVLKLSIIASIAAISVMVFRLVLSKKLPRIYCYGLWAIVLVRLLFPFSFTSVLSIFNILPAPEVIMTQSSQYPLSIIQGKAASEVSNNTLGGSLPVAASHTSVNLTQTLTFVVSCIWLAGAAGLCLFSIFAYYRAWYRLKEAVLYKDNTLISKCSEKLKLKRKVQIYTSNRLYTPVVCGLIKPRIILPLALAQDCDEIELTHIITHELVHIKRFDYLLKLISMLALCVHWFNPVIWLSFTLSQKDMEMSCDEKVISVCDNDIRREYAASLIKLAVKQDVLLNGGLLAFGESDIKSRIKGIMKFKKPKLWLGASAIIILIAIGAVLLTNGQNKEADKKEEIAVGGNKQPEAAIDEKNDTNPGIIDIRNFDMSKIEQYIASETVVINDCLVKDGPGDNYKTVGNLKYGDIVITTYKYNNEWVIFSSLKDPNQQFWVKASNLIDEKRYQDYNLRIITAKEVTVGETTLKQGNLVQVLIKDKDKSCVTIRVIDTNSGKTGWIDNKDYTMAKPGVFFNQAYLKEGTVIYTEPSLSSQIAENGEVKDGNLFVSINKEQGGWVSIFSYGPINGWVQKENIYIPMPSNKF